MLSLLRKGLAIHVSNFVLSFGNVDIFSPKCYQYHYSISNNLTLTFLASLPIITVLVLINQVIEFAIGLKNEIVSFSITPQYFVAFNECHRLSEILSEFLKRSEWV